MIDIDSKNKKIEERFVCVDCISDHPNCQYRTIEKINQQWNHTKKQQDRVLSELKTKRQEKQEKLNQQIAIMRKNYNQQLNEISEKLITEFSLPPTSKPIEINKIKQTSLQQLSNEELLSNINQILQNDKENMVQDSKIEYLKSKDSVFQKEIQSRLEHLKQHEQLDIQESINILQEIQNDNQIQGIVQLQQQIQESTKKNQVQLIYKEDLDELINSSKYIYCQKSLLNETIQKFQEHLAKIKTFESKMQQSLDNLVFTSIQKQTNEYKNKFEKDFNQLMKFCEIEKLEKNFETLQQHYEKSQIERNQYLESIEKDYKLKIQKQNNIIEELENILKNTEDKLKNKVEEENLLNERLKEENSKNEKFQQKLNDQQIKHDKEIKSLNEQINKIRTELNSRLQFKVLDIKPKILTDDYWIKLFFILQEKSKKTIKEFQLIFQGTRDGLNNNSFWNKCNGKCNLLMIFQSQSGYIFGGYSPCRWQNNTSYVQDDTLSSFIFSQTHDSIYPLILDKKKYAIYCNSGYGPCFGDGHDICINSDFKDGYSNIGNSYKLDKYDNKKSTHIFGQEKSNITECEIFEIKFI
ncbi:unnamed protein product [Paramecium octaurelia]|uniref:TLDc domain-containing protein n=1 Tax=Paramecium octaurelia TaxID=43137 RepID=A0A8S1YR44_PAROT|nr:unnamed protein product [Paramecium octaurelia]